MAKQTFKAEVKALPEGLQMECTAREFSFILDEPKELGGTNIGMNPVEALLSALGGCKAIVVKSFARKYRIKLKDIKVVCEGVLDPDGFMGANPDAKIGFSEITTHFYFDADNTDEELEEFVHFVERTCPVLDTLVNPASFDFTIGRL